MDGRMQGQIMCVLHKGHHFLAVFYVNGGVSDLLFKSLSLYIFHFFLFISFTLFKDSLVTYRDTDTEMGPSLAPSLL
jgi:hypothetical protein